MIQLDELTIAANARTGIPYSPGIGPHAERATVQLVSKEIERQGRVALNQIQLEIPYPKNPRNKCDLCVGSDPDWDWVIEVKMLRLMGRGKCL